MSNCTPLEVEIPGFNRRKIEVSFTGGDITSDGGSLLLREADSRIGLLKSVSRCLDDTRDPKRCSHSLLSLLRQRVYGLALGYEDLNDHDALRLDLGFQTSLNREHELASSSILCRLENRSVRTTSRSIHEVLFNKFVESYKRAPRKLILDFDATDDPVHENQEGRFFHGYYGSYCFLPLYEFAVNSCW